jgi:nitroreductase
MSDIWTAYSHTHRAFLRDHPVPLEVKQQLRQLAAEISQYAHAMFIEDAELITWIYDQSTIPVVDSFHLENYVNRKNSQLLAPLLIALPMLNGSEYGSQAHFEVGRCFSKMALAAHQQGLQTGYCICYETDSVQSKLTTLGLLPKDFGMHSTPFLSIGLHDPTRPWHWCPDQNKEMPGPTKQPIENYITIL